MLIRAMAEEFGIERTVAVAQAKGGTAIEVACELLGGPAATARELGISRQSLDYMLGQSGREWRAPHLIKLAALSGISIETLLESPARRGSRRGRAK